MTEVNLSSLKTTTILVISDSKDTATMLGKMLRKTWFWLLLLGALLGVAALGVTVTVLHKTSSTEFCVSCHSMQTPLAEYQGSVHFQNVKGSAQSAPTATFPMSQPPTSGPRSAP